MKISVLAVRVGDGELFARIRAGSEPRAKIHIFIRVPMPNEGSPSKVAYDQALRHLDPA
jgi:hypothetical protein